MRQLLMDIVACGINCPMMLIMWAKSLSNCDGGCFALR